MAMRWGAAWGMVAGVVCWPATGVAQMRLSEALQEAAAHAPMVRMARAEADVRQAEARLPLQGILPSARVEAGAVRTTDPIGAFGTLLRQRQVTPAAFDPARLNDPAAITNVSGGLVLEVPLINADAWLGRRAATAAADASRSQTDWTVRSTQRAVVDAYFGAVLAAARITALDAALAAAHAGQKQATSLFGQGMVTKADVLQAAVRTNELESQRADASDGALTARQQLALLLGRTHDASRDIDLPVALPDDATLRALAAADTGSGIHRDLARFAQSRADLSALHAGVTAARADVTRQSSMLLPRVNGFARTDWNAPGALFAGRRNWTLGVMASWSLFNGGQSLASLRAASARLTAARDAEQNATQRALADVDMTRRAVANALQRLEHAEAQEQLSGEAHRLVARRYAGGLATVAELLAAEAMATSSALGHAAARHALIIAVAAHRLATSVDLTSLSTLDASRPSDR